MAVRRSALLAAAALGAALALPTPAAASGLVDRDATRVRLAVSPGGIALLRYRAAGRARHVLVWGAINARHPDPAVPQVRFRLDYSGGAGSRGRPLWKRFRNACRRYDGPPLAWLVTACRAPDGSYWAVQSWQRLLPHRGFPPWLPAQTTWELRVSHWAGPVAQLEVFADWVYGGEAHDLFGRLTYLGVPVHGFRTTRTPLDAYGRNLYVDTFDSRYGPGWHRETSVVSRRPNGNFCYAFYPTRDASLPGAPARPPGNGARYRITVIGPGVTPDVAWEGPGLPDYDPRNPALVEHERRMNELVDRFAAGDPLCAVH